MKCLAVIPSRLESTRLPQKPLKLIAGTTLIERVWKQARQCSVFNRLVVATDSLAIAEVMRKAGAEVIMTSSTCHSGTDRVAEVAALLAAAGQHFDLVANVQGDMPFIQPALIDKVVRDLAAAPAVMAMGTVATPILSQEEFERPSAVKVVIRADRSACYFSRAPIPFPRSGKPGGVPPALKHMGLYVFRPETLVALSQSAPATLELAEGLEQLRALELGFQILVTVVERAEVEPAVEVDTPEDLMRAEEIATRMSN